MPQVRPEGIGGLQLWLNLPAREKMTRPKYRDLTAAAPAGDRAGRGRPCARDRRRRGGRTARGAGGGAGGGAEVPRRDAARGRHVPRGGAARAHRVRLRGPGRGAPRARAHRARAPSLVIFGDGDLVEATGAPGGGRFLLAAARPLGEPIARHGPFVMNTRAEIEQALRDLRSGPLHPHRARSSAPPTGPDPRGFPAAPGMVRGGGRAQRAGGGGRAHRRMGPGNRCGARAAARARHHEGQHGPVLMLFGRALGSSATRARRA